MHERKPLSSVRTPRESGFFVWVRVSVWGIFEMPMCLSSLLRDPPANPGLVGTPLFRCTSVGRRALGLWVVVTVDTSSKLTYRTAVDGWLGGVGYGVQHHRGDGSDTQRAWHGCKNALGCGRGGTWPQAHSGTGAPGQPPSCGHPSHGARLCTRDSRAWPKLHKAHRKR